MIGIFLLGLASSLPQEAPSSEAFAFTVDRAGDKAVQWILSRTLEDESVPVEQTELVLLAMVFGNVSDRHPSFQDLFQRMLKADFKSVKRVALRARVLEAVDRVRYQPELHQCAQFLVDNQSSDGTWGSGEPTKFPDTPRRPEPRRTGLPLRFSGQRPGKPNFQKEIPVLKHRDGKAGDFEHTFLALQGLRACHEAGIRMPKEVIERALKAVLNAQCSAADAIPGRGWSLEGQKGTPSVRMTSAGVSAVSICRHLLAEDWKKDDAAKMGIAWLGAEFDPRKLSLDALYAVRRAGRLYGTKQFGEHDWYQEGATHLLGSQRPDGSFNGRLEDTALGILFLRVSRILRGPSTYR